MSAFRKAITKFHVLWKVLIVVVCIASVLLVFDALRFRKELLKLGYTPKPFFDLTYMLAAVTIIYFMREKLISLVRGYVSRRIEELYIEEIWEEKKLKATTNLAALIWYAFTNSIGLYLSYDSDAVPGMFLGRKGSVLDHIKNWPEVPEIPYMTLYLMIQIGSRSHSTITHTIRNRGNPDFIEMLLHHALTTFCILYSYFTHCWMGGVVVLLVHDWGDLLYKAGIVYRDLFPHHWPQLITPIGVYFFSVVRIVHLPIWLVPLVYNWLTLNLDVFVHPDFAVLGAKLRFVGVFQISMLGILWLMNIYWALLIFRIIYNLIKHSSLSNDIHGEPIVQASIYKKKAS